MAIEQSLTTTILKLEKISKRFGSVHALEDVSIEVKSGEILAILGENGAGKSTLMKIISGLHQPDAGTISVDENWFHTGTPRELKVRPFSNPRDAMQLGVGMVYQHFQLVEPFTVAENIMLGKEITRGLTLDIKTAEKQISELSEKYGLPIDASMVVEDLSIGLKQRVEILKQLYRDARLLILDEPTAVLTPKEVNELFTTLRALRDSGKSLIFISHKLHEPIEIADRIVVIRRGNVVGEADPSSVTKEKLAEMVVGRKLSGSIERVQSKEGRVVLDVKNLGLVDPRTHRTVLRDISFQVHGGEIVGIAGVEGNGQSELVEVLVGLRRPSAETQIELNIGEQKKELQSTSTLSRLKQGIAFIPEDRNKRGLVVDFSVKENSWLAFHSWREQAETYIGEQDDAPFFLLPFRLMGRLTKRLVDVYKIRTPGVDETVRNLSGGNQQKVVISREFAKEPKLIIAAQPTRGVDIGVMEQVHKELIERRNQGAAVILVSADLDEILKLSDRILVMYEGRIVSDRLIEEYDMNMLSQLMLGGRFE